MSRYSTLWTHFAIYAHNLLSRAHFESYGHIVHDMGILWKCLILFYNFEKILQVFFILWAYFTVYEQVFQILLLFCFFWALTAIYQLIFNFWAYFAIYDKNLHFFCTFCELWAHFLQMRTFCNMCAQFPSYEKFLLFMDIFCTLWAHSEYYEKFFLGFIFSLRILPFLSVFCKFRAHFAFLSTFCIVRLFGKFKHILSFEQIFQWEYYSTRYCFWWVNKGKHIEKTVAWIGWRNLALISLVANFWKPFWRFLPCISHILPCLTFFSNQFYGHLPLLVNFASNFCNFLK